MNWKKEIVDQPLHFLWAGATFVAPWVAMLLPMGWRLALIAASGASLGLLCAREVWQKRDKPRGIFGNWPWLDSSFYALGAAAGTVVGVLWI